jgi:hypothetical protein
MKKIFIIAGILLFFYGNLFAWDASRNRDQFTDNEWREHEAKSESYFRARHPELYHNYKYNSHDYGYDSNNYRYRDSIRYGRDDHDGFRHGDDRAYRKYKKYGYDHKYRNKYCR